MGFHFICLMRALTSHSKRGDSSDFHISKKRKLFNFNHQNQTRASANSTVSRISKYPQSKNTKFRREIHAPCRILRFGLSKKVEKIRSFDSNMGNFLSKQVDSAKRSAISGFRYLVNEKDEKEDGGLVSAEDSSVEVIEDDDDNGVFEDEIECVEKGRFEDNEVKVVEERSVVSNDDVNLVDLETAGEKFDSLVLNGDVDFSGLKAYKKLLESAERRNARLEALSSEIQLNEKRLSFYQSIRPVKRVEERVKEIPKEPFIALTEQEEAEVNRAFLGGRKVLVSHENSNIDITGDMLGCLRPGQWLNDEVINVYLELLKEREKREPKKFLKCHFFNTFFYNKLLNGDYKAVRRWTTERKLGYFLADCDKIFVPVHREIHWCLAIINKKDRKFQYLDSLKGRDFRVLEILAKYYVEEVKDKSKKDIDVSDWEREFVEDLPEQKNGYDCGVFMVKYADFYSRDIGLCFGQGHMPYFRMRTAKEILKLRAD